MSGHELFRVLRYEPHPGQALFHGSAARIKVLIAGARFGKSLAAARDVLRDVLTGGGSGWLVAPSYALARHEFRYLREDLGPELGAGAILADGGLRAPSSMLTRWGGQIETHSAKSAESLLGAAVDFMLLCEAAHIPHEVFMRFLRARLTSHNGRLIVPTTPHGLNWVHELYQRGLEGGECESFRFRTADNPLIDAGEIESARATLPDSVFAEQYEGEFVQGSGRVYKEFSRAVHVCSLPIPPGAVIHRGLDFGYTNPLACLWGCEVAGRLQILREYVAQGLTLTQHAEHIRAIDEQFRAQGCSMSISWGDPSGSVAIAELNLHSVAIRKAPNAVLPGIDKVRQALLARADGPGLLVDASCSTLIREFENYHWQEALAGAEAAPAKKDDHALDALRYLVSGMAQQVGWNSNKPVW